MDIENKAKVSIIMGSKSDAKTMKKAADMLKELEIPYVANIFSAHRTPDELADFVRSLDDTYEVIIAGAGMSAALAGAIAAETMKPVIGIPLSGGKFYGVEAMLSTLEMPPGNPVLTVGVDAAKNAALAAARIIALHDSAVRAKLMRFKEVQAKQVIESNAELDF